MNKKLLAFLTAATLSVTCVNANAEDYNAPPSISFEYLDGFDFDFDLGDLERCHLNPTKSLASWLDGDVS